MNTYVREGDGEGSPALPGSSLAKARRELQESLTALRAVAPEQALQRIGLAGEGVDALTSVMAATDSLLDASFLIGECQIEVPFAALRPVITPEGEFRWCCSHEKQHSVRPGG